MYSKTGLAVEELSQILDGVWEYNRLGAVAGLVFLDPAGKPVEVATIEVIAGAPALALRSAPEEDGREPVSPEQRAALEVERLYLAARSRP